MYTDNELLRNYIKEEHRMTHCGTNTIETERLVLRRFRYTDDEAMLAYWQQKLQRLSSFMALSK